MKRTAILIYVLFDFKCGECKKQTNGLYGKTLNVSFFGPEPFITYNPVGGSDFLIVKLMSKQLKFTPNFISEESFDKMVYRVSFLISSVHNSYV